jgi:hypothetical protein
MTSVLAFFPAESQMPLGLCITFTYIIILLLGAPYIR